MEPYWKKWFKRQTQEDKEKMALVAIERLIELEEISMRAQIPGDDPIEECLYWDSCGDDIRD